VPSAPRSGFALDILILFGKRGAVAIDSISQRLMSLGPHLPSQLPTRSLSFSATVSPSKALPKDRTMSRTIRLQSDSNAHDRPWRVAVEQGFFAAEGLTVEYHEDNPKGTAGRVEDFSQRWRESLP